MNILFLFPREKAYDSTSVRELPCGGTEKAVIFLGEAFQKLGHRVGWCTEIDQLHDYLTRNEIWDVVITQEAEFLQAYPMAKKVWWTHHFANQPIIQRNAPFGRSFADKVVTLSRCHSEDFKTHLRLDSVVIGHGVWLDELHPVSDKDPYRLIYASTPFRGLEKIPALFKAIREKESRATISICSSMGTYGHPEKDAEYQRIFDELQDMEGVELKGALNQAELYQEYAKASIFIYPCIWPETYCCALDEAIAHGCFTLTSDLGALVDRARVASPNFDYLLEWVSRLMCENVDYYLSLSSWQDVKPRDWLAVAQQWEKEVLK